ncbi:HD domain-containing protein [Deinococcus sp. KNUC1210]|uniref:HD domain-containing protein n=1 Tax=Deinococcus sp. KNUC1210 TaxID=2917691 RepID=UPI001EF0E35C|nr:HD domain-containing protein [Deinococcus sp. KNUC1210]ULH16355.1 HD domain-containing protein [Deinococcus sp. KNUC1210]
MFRRAPSFPAALRQLWPNGAVLVGGAARDLLRGRTPKDWDWAAPEPKAAAETLTARLDGAMFALDEVRGYYRVVSGQEQHDFVPLPADLNADLRRRDFTVNALALHPDGRLSDPLGGERDLRKRLLRMVSAENLRADPLRLLRAARLSLTLDLSLEPETRRTVTELAASGLPLPAPERMREELHALLMHPQAARGILLLEELGLLGLSLPELREGIGLEQGGFHHLDVFRHGVEALHQVLQRFPAAPLDLRWATLLHDVGKPRSRSQTGSEVHFYGHDRLGAELSRRMLDRLREASALSERVGKLIAAHMVPLPHDERAARRFVHRRRDLLPDLLALMLADREAARGPMSSEQSRLHYAQGIDRVLAALEDQPAPPPPLLTGQDIMALLNLPPGPGVGEAVRALSEAAALGDVDTPEQARRWLLTWAESVPTPPEA